MYRNTGRTILALLAVLLLGGSECTIVAKSGSSSSNSEQEQGSTLLVVIGDGRLVDSPVEGVYYVSGRVSGISGTNGEFEYEEGQLIRFFIGDIALGEATAGQPLLSPLDLVPGGTIDSPAVINIARLLQSLDSDPGDAGITIPPILRQEAVLSNDMLSSHIRYLDFADDAAFANAASQLVATLTKSYPFNAVLVDAERARAHLLRSLAEHGLVAIEPPVADPQ